MCKPMLDKLNRVQRAVLSLKVISSKQPWMNYTYVKGFSVHAEGHLVLETVGGRAAVARGYQTETKQHLNILSRNVLYLVIVQ